MITVNDARNNINKTSDKFYVRKILRDMNNDIDNFSKEGKQFMSLHLKNNYLNNLDLIKCSFIKRGFKIINLSNFDGIKIIWDGTSRNSLTNLRFVVYLKLKNIKRFISNVFKAKTSNPIVIG